MKVLWLVGALAFLACGPPERWKRLPEQDRARWERCVLKVQAARCGPSYESDMVYRSICTSDLADKYIGQPSSEHRVTWLKGNGCPPAMVEPRRH